MEETIRVLQEQDADFKRCYDANLNKILTAITTYSGIHTIDENVSRQFIETQLTPMRRKAARDLIENTIYITLEEINELTRYLIIELYKTLNPDDTVYFYTGQVHKSNYFINVLALYHIRDLGYKDPVFYINSPPNFFKYIEKSPIIMIDDVSYSGSQMAGFLSKYYQWGRKDNIYILLIALNAYSLHNLSSVYKNKMVKIPTPYKFIYHPNRFYPTLFETLGMTDYITLNLLFSFWVSPVISLYMDHKIADPISTYKFALMYGPIIPSNYATSRDFINEMYDIQSMNQNVTVIEIMAKIFSLNLKLSDIISSVKNIMQNIIEDEMTISTPRAYVEFFPFIRGCNQSGTLKDIIKSIRFNKILYIELLCQDDEMFEGIIEKYPEYKQRVLREIYDYVYGDENYSCPISWYKKGEYKIECPTLSSSLGGKIHKLHGKNHTRKKRSKRCIQKKRKGSSQKNIK
jgi:hypothetical protein